MKLRLSVAALEELRQIRQWSRDHWGTAQADKFANDLATAMERLVEQPKMGRQRPSLGDGIRSIQAQGHTILYIVTSQGPAILAVLHDKRNVYALDLSRRLDDL